MKAHIVVHHIETDNFWEGVWSEVDDDDVFEIALMIEKVNEEKPSYFRMRVENGNLVYLPWDILKGSAWWIETDEEV